MLIKDDQFHPTFIIYTLNNRLFESLINQKLISLISSALLDSTPCLIYEIGSSNS